MKVVQPEKVNAEADARFTQLVQQHARFVYRVVHAVLRHTHDAEDVVQETFLKLYRSGAWRQMRDEKAFLARAAWRLAVSRLGNSGREVALPDDVECGAEFAVTTANPEQAVMEANEEARVHALVDTLPEKLRQPLVLTALEELNSREIAAVMGISEGTVRTRLLRARKLLKEKLRDMR